MLEKTIEDKICNQCSCDFSITDKDLEFYQKVSPKINGNVFEIPSPNFCPDCRQQRRLSFFNYKSLYKNICGMCNNDIIARFPYKSNVEVLCIGCWSEKGEEDLPKGEGINFGENIFSQIKGLISLGCYQSLIGSLSNIENNSEYTNHTSEIKDSYLVFEANTIESSYYCFGIKNSKHALDSSFSGNNQYIFMCVDCYEMYQCFYSQKSFGCKFSYFLENCENCSHCIGCSNLSNQKYCILNEQVSPKEYEKLKGKFGKRSSLKNFKQEFEDFAKKVPKKYANLVGSENSIGNNIINSNNCQESYDILGSSDCKYSTQINYSQDIYDVSSYGEKSSLMYDSVSVGRFSSNILFSSIVGKGENLLYCIEVKKSKNCFACVNLKGKQYCILNKQYTKEEYNILVPKIIKKMQQDGEWGEFFPSNISPFGYNETVASEYFPLEKEEAIKQGCNWSSYQTPISKVEKIISADKLPDDIKDIPDDILNWAIECEITKKPFRIIPQELEFYRKHNLPAPRRHPDQRHLARMKLRNPRKLFERNCDKCGISMKTTYSPERSETVYCEGCYNKEVY